MRVISLSDLNTRKTTHFGSQGFGILPMTPDAHVALATLSPGGRIGRHPAAVDQCLVVVAGDAHVSGEDGIPHLVGPGSAALWAAGESHETCSQNGLSALIVQAEGLIAAIH